MAQTQNPLNKIKDTIQDSLNKTEDNAQDSLNKIKNKIYEAEGLLELLFLRQDKLRELAPMILSRLAAAQADFQAYCSRPTESEVSDQSDEPTESGQSDQSNLSPESAPSDNSYYSDNSDISDSPAPSSRPRPSFCLNDRYRFRRAIFGGSDAEMNTTLDFIASMPSYADAEDFFLTDMDLSTEDEDVVDFLNIIRNYFGE